jgi:predicted RNase H-like nuclease (RuvC/YqgF family)
MKYLPLFSALLIASLASQAQANINSGELVDANQYKSGKEQFDKKNYLQALKMLYAYETINEDKLKLDKYKTFARQLNDAIKQSEDFIQSQMTRVGNLHDDVSKCQTNLQNCNESKIQTVYRLKGDIDEKSKEVDRLKRIIDEVRRKYNVEITY